MHQPVSHPPKLSVSALAQHVKGKSSRVLQAEFPELKRRYWGRQLWAWGYFVASSGTVTDGMIKACIEQQDIPPDDGFPVTDEKLQPAFSRPPSGFSREAATFSCFSNPRALAGGR